MDKKYRNSLRFIAMFFAVVMVTIASFMFFAPVINAF